MQAFTMPDGRRLRYKTLGQGAPVLLLHGYLNSHKTFFRLFDDLAASHSLIALDQRGHGDSDPAAAYSIAGFTADAIVLPEAGHAPNWERPEQAATALLKFWSEHA